MAELLSAGYQSLRDFLNSSVTIPNDWDYIELYDDTGTAVTRVSITSDARCSWGDVDGDNVLTVTFNVTGSDSDIPLPTTVSSTAIWDSSSAGNQITTKESFPNATINQSGDNVEITHTLNIPQ